MNGFLNVLSVLSQGRLAEAVDAYERALAVAPNFEIVRNNLAIALTELGTKTKVNGGECAGIISLGLFAKGTAPMLRAALSDTCWRWPLSGSLRKPSRRALAQQPAATRCN